MKLTSISLIWMFPLGVFSWSTSSAKYSTSKKNLPSGRNNVTSRRDVTSTLLIDTVATSCFALGIKPPSSARAETSSDDDYAVTPRGLKYKIVTPPIDPNSPTPRRAQKVKTKYTLYLNGFPEDTDESKKIDSSKGLLGDKPFEFLAGVSQVIKGWDLTLLDMREGESRRIVVPYDLGYGEDGAGGGKIPKRATLYFDLELVGLGAMSKMGPEQYKWLEEHPL